MSKNRERSIQQIIIDSYEHYANLSAYLTTEEHRAYLERHLNWQFNIALFNEFLDRDKEIIHDNKPIEK